MATGVGHGGIDIIQQSYPENPLLCARILVISPAQAELLPILSQILLLYQQGSVMVEINVKNCRFKASLTMTLIKR